MKKTAQRLLSLVVPEKTYGSSLSKISRPAWAFPCEGLVAELADELQAKPEIIAVGLVDKQGLACGLVSRDHLFSLLGKPFGREILSKRSVMEISQDADHFDSHANVYTIAAELKARLDSPELSIFLLRDALGRYQGLFTSHDLLAFLSRITQEDIMLASGLQERLVNEVNRIDAAAWGFRAWARFAKGVGGDFTFARKISEHRHFFTLCDVSGKGVAASIISSMVWGMLKTFDFAQGLGSLVREINQAVITTFQLEKYLTGIFMVFHEGKQRLSIADMGHSHTLVFRKGKAVAVKSPSSNMPIGIDPNLDPLLFALRLQPGDVVLAFSDGITEQENGQGQEFGEDRIKETVLRCLAEGSDLSVELPRAVDEFRGATPQQDDMSFICLSLADGRA